MNIKNRNIEIDFIKGILVIVMLVHHSLDFLSGEDLQYLYKYVRFVTGAFVFMSGFMVSHIYLAKYNFHDDALYRRLFIRAIKILLIFTVANILIKMLIKQENFGTWEISLKVVISNIYTIYLVGDYRTTVFHILTPIAYTLIVTGIFVYLLKERIRIFKYFVLAFMLYCSFAFFDMKDGYYLRFLSIGLCGFSLGFVDMDRINAFLKHKFMIFSILLIYLLYINLFKLYYPAYIFSVVVTLMTIYLIGLQLPLKSIPGGKILLIGRYSLLAYLIQIAVFQLLIKFLEMIPQEVYRATVGLLITTLIMYLLIEMTDYFRNRSVFFKKAYQLVFA